MEGKRDRGRETRKLAVLHMPFDQTSYGTITLHISNATTNHVIIESHTFD